MTTNWGLMRALAHGRLVAQNVSDPRTADTAGGPATDPRSR